MVVAKCPSVPGCVLQGRSEEGADGIIREAIRACLETRIEDGLPLTVAIKKVKVML